MYARNVAIGYEDKDRTDSYAIICCNATEYIRGTHTSRTGWPDQSRWHGYYRFYGTIVLLGRHLVAKESYF